MKTQTNQSGTGSEALAVNSALSRRSILKITGLTGGGLALAFSLGRGGVFAHAAEGPDGQVFEPNGYIRIDPDGAIRIYAKNPEIGQGVKTSLPMILAEELDAAWSDVHVELSPVSEELYGRQGAGGSRSIPSCWDELRQAGAVARAMLVSAAARRWKVAEEECETADSAVMHSPTGRRLSYGELAVEAGGLPIPDPETVRLKSRDEYRLLGTRVSDVDIGKIVGGEPLYSSDHTVPGMLYAVYEKCPARRGTVVSANLDHVRSLKGVLDAFVLEGSGNVRDLAPGVAIVAESTWAALKAKLALVVEWDETNASKDTWSGSVAAARDLAGRPGAQVILDKGDVGDAFAQAANVVEASYSYPFIAHATMEPQNCVAWHRGDEIEIWAGSQSPQRAKTTIAEIFGVPKDKVIVHQFRAGGGFGRRSTNDAVCDAVAISERVGAPVKVQWTREDDMRNDHYRPGGFHHMSGALDGSGRLTALRDHFVTFTENGTDAIRLGDMGPVEFPAPLIDNVEYTKSLLPWAIPSGPWRAPRSNAFAFVFQSFLHELSTAAGRDHVEFLLDILGEPRWLEPGNTRSLNTGRTADVIKLAAEKAGWGTSRPEGRGLGLGFYFSHAGHIAEVAEVSMEADNKLTVHKVTVAADVGPIVNLSGAEGQMEGAVIDGISSMLSQTLSIENGRILEGNFDRYPLLKIAGAPEVVDVHFIQSEYPPTGLGEPALPPLIPAVANAIFDASGQRVRSLPLNLEGFSV